MEGQVNWEIKDPVLIVKLLTAEVHDVLMMEKDGKNRTHDEQLRDVLFGLSRKEKD